MSSWSRNNVDALAVSSYAGPMNSSHEQRAAEIIHQMVNLPVVQAHHLSSELDSIRRATTASLNAALLSNLHDFLEAVQSMATRHGLKCPIMLVRGDGSIVKAEFARQRPVEMVHSGPATSALGGQFLAGVEKALVVDMGGTTTDLTLIDGGRIQAMEQSATVGEYRTCVRTIRARSFGLGGDSLIKFDHWQKLCSGSGASAADLADVCSLPFGEAGFAGSFAAPQRHFIFRSLRILGFAQRTNPPDQRSAHPGGNSHPARWTAIPCRTC